jgi:membrane protein implicated in regulation of membrane protease activity
MSTAQIVFAIALGAVSLAVVVFAVYVLSSAAWGDRWVRHRDAGAVDEP